MKRISIVVTAFILTGFCESSYAGCNCADWVKRDGYCVDYVKTRIPAFPIPNTVTEIANLANKEIQEVAEGDVAIFDLGNYWHVAYVEKVRLDQQGKATAIDASEMNFGGSMSFNEYKQKWRPKSKSEWKRALCCGVTDQYDQTTIRKNVSLATVKQIWSPDPEDSVVDKVREVLNRFFHFTEREL